jgi:exopolyphosphatase / guanosine-5'-triphosphate,3'-diphosphate pyrophosphatase
MTTVSSLPANTLPEPPGHTVAVIDIGASSVRMEIAEIRGQGEVRTLESLAQGISLGHDTFTQRRIRKGSIEECVRALRSYRKILDEYGITRPDQMRVVATSAVREALNRLAFVDRVYIATGLVVEPLDEAEVNRITYLGIQALLETEPRLASSRTMVVEIGGGSTEVLVVRGGNVLLSGNYRLGSLRLLETLEKFDAPRTKLHAIMERQIRRMVEQISEQIDRSSMLEVVAIGGDVRFAASHLLDAWPQGPLAVIPVDGLLAFTQKLLALGPDEIALRFGLNFQDAETVGPALLCYSLLARNLNCQQLYVAQTNLRDGLLRDFALRDRWTSQLRDQIVRSAIGLGRKFGFDEKHARHVADLSQQLFRQLQAEHQLDPRMELILYLSALLHEIGLFVNVRSNHKHAMYLIRNSELFGLNRRDVLRVALVARYHRRASPQPDHEGYAGLQRDDRVAVCKLAAMLRLAIALDETRSQRIASLDCRVEAGKLLIRIADFDDLALEHLSLRQNSGLFEEVFGLSVVLRPIRNPD